MNVIVKKSTIAAVAAAALGPGVDLPPDRWSAWQRLCDDRGTVVMRLAFDDNNMPYLYVEETGQIVKNLTADFDLEIDQDYIEHVVVRQTIDTDKRLFQHDGDTTTKPVVDV